jgi:hypothetical protein
MQSLMNMMNLWQWITCYAGKHCTMHQVTNLCGTPTAPSAAVGANGASTMDWPSHISDFTCEL